MGDLSHVKRIDATQILEHLGIPWKRYGNCLMTWAIWRGDRDPSVRIRQMPENGHWVFADYGGSNRGGTMIDYLSLATGLSIGETVRWLEEFAEGNLAPLSLLYPLPEGVGNSPSGTRKQREPSRMGAGIEVLQEWQANCLDNEILENDLYTHRKLRFKELPDEVKVVLILLHPHERRRFQFAIRNRSGGLEHCAAAPRSSPAGFAGNLGGKDVVLLTAESEKTDSICLVEGLWDACTVRRMGWAGQILCLTSTSMAKHAVGVILGEKKLREVRLALDDDVSGRVATETILAGLSEHISAHVLRISRMDLEGAKDPCDLWLRKLDEYGGIQA